MVDLDELVVADAFSSNPYMEVWTAEVQDGLAVVDVCTSSTCRRRALAEEPGAGVTLLLRVSSWALVLMVALSCLAHSQSYLKFML